MVQSSAPSLQVSSMAKSQLHVLQEGRERSAREHRQGLFQSLNLIIPGGLTKFKVLEREIAALVKICVLVHELLNLTHGGLQLTFGFDLLPLSLGLHITFGHNVLGLCFNGGVRVLDKALVRLLRVLLSPDASASIAFASSMMPCIM